MVIDCLRCNTTSFANSVSIRLNVSLVISVCYACHKSMIEHKEVELFAKPDKGVVITYNVLTLRGLKYMHKILHERITSLTAIDNDIKASIFLKEDGVIK